MNKLYSVIFLVLISGLANAQAVTANDSVITGAGNINMVFYSLSTGTKTVSSDTDWHIAVTVRPGMAVGATTVRINEARGVNAYIAQNADTGSFATLDTTGWQNWWHLHDADTSIDEGALNSNRNHTNIFDFGWGMYDQYNYNVIGDSVYLLQLPSGELKKLVVIDLNYDTAFDIKYSNIDNSNLQYVHISLAAYSTKNFVYLNLNDDSIRDKEPASANWDLEFLKYAAVDTPGVQGGTFPVAGVWTNYGAMDNGATTVAKAAGVDVTNNTFMGLTFSSNLNSIGWNWKPLNDSSGVVQDSLAYFIKTNSGDYYKLVFTGYTDSTGIFRFYEQKLNESTGVKEMTNEDIINIYPNPANDKVNISLPSPGSIYQLMDVRGSIILEGSATTNGLLQLNTGALPSGFYIVNFIDNGLVSTKKLIVEH